MNKDYIIYTGNFDFSEKIAAGKRVLGISYALRELGYKVIFIGSQTNPAKNQKMIETKKIVDGFESYMMPYPITKKDWMSYKKQYSNFTNLITEFGIEDKIHSIILYGSPCISLWSGKIIKWSKKRKINVVSDVVDWINGSSGSILFRIVKWLDTNYAKAYLNTKTDGVIAISKFLADYYKRKGCNTIQVPPITNAKNYTFNISVNETSCVTKFIYVGMPFGKLKRKSKKENFKDRLDIAIESFAKLINKSKNFEFNIYGVSKQEYLTVLPEHGLLLENLKDNVFFHGKITNAVVTEKISEADFSILIRDINRVTTAGFPTKFSESISCGTPFITNKTSNIEDYLKDGENGFWIDTDNKIICDKLFYITSLPRDVIDKMKMNCSESLLFDYHKYKDVLTKVITDV